ncbi:hypothetical protein AWC38_SpisGene10875 [Stylophora pistillata]|uniref:Uncharacterized protein n=1 Tax=Stylophora pistillata TaxID=50429 RepID=A0A2B4S6T3_STYPI|nr:hypothetical protein AWC38_SpisGene10875 [Stylophora pistillata]
MQALLRRPEVYTYNLSDCACLRREFTPYSCHLRRHNHFVPEVADGVDNSARRVAVQRNFGTGVLEVQEREFRQQSREEENASGISREPTELDALLEEISEREKLAESTRESCSSRSVEIDRKRAEETRFQALEKVGETKRRANEDCDRKAKRQRRSGADVAEFLRENSEKELKIREEELALKAKEVENEKERQAQMFKTQEAMITNMAKQQDQMQTLQMAFLQQQQTQAMMVLLERLAKK